MRTRKPTQIHRFLVPRLSNVVVIVEHLIRFTSCCLAGRPVPVGKHPLVYGEVNVKYPRYEVLLHVKPNYCDMLTLGKTYSVDHISL